MSIHLFSLANEIIKKIEEAGYEAYIVGGAVRDFMLKRAVHDVDITTSASCNIIKNLFSRTIDVAIKHGTIIVRHQDHNFEVTSFRGNSLNEDLRRRDFTINAMALTKDGMVIDPFKGEYDLSNRYIRAVDNPCERLKEDPLRILRAIRFVSELSFKIEDKTLMAINQQKSNLAMVAMERIASEFEKICLGNDVEKSFSYIRNTQIFEQVPSFNEISKALNDPNMAESIQTLNDLSEVWTLLLYSVKCKKPAHYLRLWKQSKKIITEVEAMLNRLPSIVSNGFTEEDLYFLGQEKIEKVERVRASIQKEAADTDKVVRSYEYLPIKERKQLAINGEDVLALLNESQPKSQVGILMGLLEKTILVGKIENNKSEIIRWLIQEGLIDEK
jgi:tRNA nucleotidyltransferase (CCA-adding enzyme)